MLKIAKPKPIIRWTIGNVDPLGFDILKHSIELFRKNYKDYFRVLICHNGLNEKQMRFVKSLGASTLKQPIDCGIIYKASGVAWKLYPPRFDIRTHEIFIDNDLILYKKLDEINEFLERNDLFFITEGYKRNFGNYDRNIASNIKLNSGLFGLPPRFDFAQAIKQTLKKDVLKWQNRYDEQGVVSSIITKQNYTVIPLNDLHICFKNFIITPKGAHFVGANGGQRKYWNQYQKFRKNKCSQFF